MEGEGVGACSLVRNTLGVEGRAKSSGIEIRKIDKQVNYSHGHAQTKQKVG